MNKISKNFIAKSGFLWLIGWLSLGLIEVGLRLTMISPTLTQILLFTLLIYSLFGVISGSIFGIILLLISHLVRGLKEPDRYIPLSMGACISLIFFLSIIIFSLKVGHSLMFTFKNGLLALWCLVMIFLLTFFFQWMDRKGRLFISYLSLLPSLWIITSLKLNTGKELLPSILQINTFSRIFLLILGSILCFFLVYYFLSMSRRFFNRWKGIPLLKPAFISLSLIVLLLCLSFFLRKEGYQNNRNEIKNAPIGKPNILLITMDATRADHLSCYGYERLTTPNLDKLSREGVLYKNAYSTTSWTLPSHASIFTGMYPTNHGADYKFNSTHSANNLSKKQKGRDLSWLDVLSRNLCKLSDENLTLAEILSERGYRTAGIIGGPWCSSSWGLGQGFDYCNETFINVEDDVSFFLIYQIVNHFFSLYDFFTQYGYLGKRIASHLNKATFRWLDKNYQWPFFLFINYLDTHGPYLPPPPYDRYFKKIDKGIITDHNPPGALSFIEAESRLAWAVIGGRHRLTPEEKELFISYYDGEIRYLDHHLSLLFEKLKALKVYDKTMIIVTADHGQAFGEHNEMYHGMSLYEEVLRVPLIIKYPYSSQQGIIEKRVSLVDLLPTVLSLLNYPIPSGIDGEILEKTDHPIIAELIKEIPKREYRAALTLKAKAIYLGKYKYISSNFLNELYDLEKDPEEKENLVEKLPKKAQAMEKILKEWLASIKPQKAERERVKINKSMEEVLRALGYVK